MTEDVPEREIRMHLAEVEKAARDVMSRMHSTWQAYDSRRE